MPIEEKLKNVWKKLLKPKKTQMKIYTTLQIGEFHTNYCEDFLITEEFASNQILVAVLDLFSIFPCDLA